MRRYAPVAPGEVRDLERLGLETVATRLGRLGRLGRLVEEGREREAA